MMTFVGKIKTFELYVHDKDIFSSIDLDDIDMVGGPELLKALSPPEEQHLMVHLSLPISSSQSRKHNWREIPECGAAWKQKDAAHDHLALQRRSCNSPKL